MLRLFGLLFITTSAFAANPFLTGHTEVIAHRGGIGPDSTLANIKRSLERGYRFIELDVRLTKDGHAVILHDATVDRTTNGTGAIAEMTFAEARKLDAGAKYTDPQEPKRSFAGERIPTPTEVLQAVGPKGVVLLELKVPEAAEPVAKAIAAEQAWDRAIIRTADRKVLAALKKQYPKVRLGTMTAIPKDDLPRFIKELQAIPVDAVTPLANASLTPMVVRALHDGHIAVWATNTNDVAVMKELLQAKPAGIITDVPAQLQGLLPKRTLP